MRSNLPVLLIMLLAMACSKNDKFHDEEMGIVNVSIGSVDGRINVPDVNNYTKTVDSITVPVKIVLSATAPKIFSVSIGVNNDTISQLIGKGQLADAVLLEETYYRLPRTAEIRFGIDTLAVPLEVSMQAVERYYGKKLALAVHLDNPGKQNTLSPAGRTAIVLINTAEIIQPNELHYLYFTEAGKVLSLPSGTDHTLGTTEVTIPVSVSLGGVAGGSFTVNLNADPDTVQTLINNGTLAGSVLLANNDDYTLPAAITFDANKNVAKFNLKVKTAALQRNVNNKPALAVTLSDPTKHLLDPAKRTLVMVLDPSRLIETDITNTNVKYTVQFENTSNSNENSPKLIDNNINTKFLLFNFTSVWAQLEFATPQTTGAYTMTSANDAPGRDPKEWTIEGSDNGTDWVVLDRRTDQTFGSRLLTVKYTFNNAVAFKYYRLNITRTAGDGLFQLAEWRLLKRP